MKKIAIIVAGGTGIRMGSEIPKQFIEINSKPIIIYSFEAFYNYDKSIRFILVLHADYFSSWKKIIRKYPDYTGHDVVEGGKTRFHSVQNAVKIIKEEALVAVHDSVRPLVSTGTIARCFETAADRGCAIPCIEVSESLREITSSGNKPIDRSRIKIIQTPQVFRSDILMQAYKIKYKRKFTDDATVAEDAGYEITLTEGNRNNIKITTKEDLIFAESILAKRV